MVESFPRSPDVLSELIREAQFYQLDGLTSALKLILLRESSIVDQIQVKFWFKYLEGGIDYRPGYDTRTEYRTGNFTILYRSVEKIELKHKNMRGLCFDAKEFAHPVSFSNCDLTNAIFHCSVFNSDAIFEDCILDNTTFNYVTGLVNNSGKVIFTGSKTDKTNFDPDIRSSLQSSGKIP